MTLFRVDSMAAVKALRTGLRRAAPRRWRLLVLAHGPVPYYRQRTCQRHCGWDSSAQQRVLVHEPLAQGLRCHRDENPQHAFELDGCSGFERLAATVSHDAYDSAHPFGVQPLA